MLDILLIMAMHMKVVWMKILVPVVLEWFVVQYSLGVNLEGNLYAISLCLRFYGEPFTLHIFTLHSVLLAAPSTCNTPAICLPISTI